MEARADRSTTNTICILESYRTYQPMKPTTFGSVYTLLPPVHPARRQNLVGPQHIRVPERVPGILQPPNHGPDPPLPC